MSADRIWIFSGSLCAKHIENVLEMVNIILANFLSPACPHISVESLWDMVACCSHLNSWLSEWHDGFTGSINMPYHAKIDPKLV